MAAVLYFQVGARSVAGGIENRGGENIAGGEDVADKYLAVIGLGAAHHIGYRCFMGIADYPFDSGHGGEFVGGSLGITSCDQDACFRVFAMDPADRGAGVAIGFGGNGAGVQDDEFGVLSRVGFDETAGGELGLERRAIGLSGSAAEILYVKASH